MNTLENQSVEDLKKKLGSLSFADLKEEFNTLGITHVWKGGVKKDVLINAAIEELTKQKPITEELIVETSTEEKVELPSLEVVSEEDAEKLLEEERLQKVIDRAKELGIETEGLEEDDLYEAILDAEALLEPQDTETQVDDEDPNPLVKTEEVEDLEVEAEVVKIEVIDETLFTEEEILENIEITQANLQQALPATRTFLLRKADALEAALSRKRE